MTFLVFAAVGANKLSELCNRIKTINGELPKPHEEQLKFTLFKDYATGVTLHDMQAFINWLLVSSPGVCGKRELLMNKLKQLKHERYAHLHVYCEDGPVPPARSMFSFHTDSVSIFFSSQGQENLSSSWPDKLNSLICNLGRPVANSGWT